MMVDLVNKRVVITGVGKGLGLALTESMLSRGATVYGGYFSDKPDALQELASRYNTTLILNPIDIGDTASVEVFCDQVKMTAEQIDLLINNAGILGDIDSQLGEKLDYEDMIQTFNVNALGSLRVSNELLNVILASDSKTVVNICSEAGSIADNTREGWFGYCMSKAAMNMGGSIVHQTLRKQGGRVIQIHPGYLKTYMHGYFNDDGELTADEASEMILHIVLEQLKEPIGEQPVYISSKGERLPW